MNTRAKYKTKSRELLLGYLKSLGNAHTTAGDICTYLKNKGEDIGQSTVYRQLESLVNEGLVKKYVIDPNTPACFEFAGAECNIEQEPHFHCKCEKCGRLIHLHCSESKDLQKHILNHHGFKINSARTVFYGLCDNCK